MPETFTTEYKGYTVTVWMRGIGVWNYIISKGKFYRAAYISAQNRNQAVIEAVIDAGIGV